jgi:hypothetical protein
VRRTILLVTALATLSAGILTAMFLTPASAARLKVTARFAPSGTVSVDPTGHALTPSEARRLAASLRAIPPSISGTSGCSDHSATNVRANQECTNQSGTGYLGRGQSQNETGVAVNPTNAKNVLISQNDYRRGDGSCGVDWSMDGGTHWGSELAPAGFGLPVLDNGGVRHYWTSGGDTSVAFDSTGEAYLMCQVFDRGFPTDERGPNAAFGASGFMIFRSADGGASWSFPGDYVKVTGGSEDPNATIGLLDKEYMTIDNNPDSPHRDRIYVTWTEYDSTFTSAPISLAYSDDHGASWTQVGAISGFSTSLCPINFSGAQAGTCDNDQDSDPFVAPNGDLYVTFVNGNNCAGALQKLGFDCPGSVDDNHNQMLIVKSTDGGVTFGDPVKVSDYYELPDCLTYTGLDAGRACVPTQPLSGKSIFRASNYPTGVALSASDITVYFGSYINAHSNTTLANCAPKGLSGATLLNRFQGVGVAGGCNNDIVISTSHDGGQTFDGTSTPVEELPTTRANDPMADQWWQWADEVPSGGAAVSFYDRSYGNAESSGYMDFVMNRSNGTLVRLTDRSMPPSNEFPDANGYSDFLGDYTGLAVGPDGIAHPAWMDTRNPIFTFDLAGDPRVLIPAGFGSDVYTRALSATG